ncbi:MAG: MATE family efflux transporter [Phycisphaerae bacterium]|nr:MATE family efflux transporter [Phycisphaerae bacterium]
MTRAKANPEILSPDPHRFWGLGEVLALAWPASLSMLSHTVMMFFDGIMVASIGPDPLGAQFVGGITSFIPAAFMFGVLTVVNTYVSQNLGAGRLERCGQYAWAGLTVALCFALLAQLLSIPAGAAMRAFGHGPRVAALEAMYFRYMLLNLIPMLMSKVLEQFFYGLGRSNVVLLSSFLANAVNIFANWVLIYGHWGLPAMGLEGAAVGTVLGTLVMLGVLAAMFLSRRTHRRYATRRAGDMKLRECGEILRIGWPAGVQFCADVLAWGMITAFLIGKFGMDHLAANTTAIRYMSLSFMPAVGIGIATTALVGRYIGESRPDLALRRVRAALIAAVGYMGLCGLFFFLFRHELVRFYISIAPSDVASAEIAARVDSITHIGARLLLCAAIFQVFDAAAIIYNGALRGAGDTFWPMVTTIALCWLLQVGGGFTIVHNFPGLTSLGPWISASAFIVALSVVFCWRFESGQWRKIDLLKREELPPAPVDSTLEA